MAPWMVLGGPFTAPRMVRGDHLQLPWMVRGDHPLCDRTAHVQRDLAARRVLGVGRMRLMYLAARRVLHIGVAYLFRQNGVNGLEGLISGLALCYATPTTYSKHM